MSYDLGKILIKNKQFAKALNFFKKILNNDPNDLRANFHTGKIYYELNDLNKSILYFKKCNQIQPQTPNIMFNLALGLQGTGKIKDAEKIYLDLLTINPKDIKSYYALFSLNIDNINPKFYKNLKVLIKEEKISLFEKSLINFILSKIEKKNKNIRKEIDYLSISHKQCYEANIVFNNQSDFYYKDIISKFFNKIKFYNSYKKVTNFNNSKHIFIIGLPRSGSTLVETIISHNSNKVKSLGEFHGINTSILSQISNKIYSKNFNNKNYHLEIDKKIFQESLIEKYKNTGKNLFLDKSLENFFNIEIILEFFPNSKFIHTHRNFKDAVIAIYQTMLPELSWSHKIEDIILYMNLYKKTINYFKKKYPDKIIDVELNKLTNQKELETKKILNFCEIKFKEDFLDFNKNNKLFNKTNSFLQVRNAIKKYDDKKYKSYHYLLNNYLNYKFE